MVTVPVGRDGGSVTLVSVRRVRGGLAANLSLAHLWQGLLAKACQLEGY